jgi:long-chain fatty acid transport protein
MADVTWTNWSRFDELRIEFDANQNGVTLADSVTTESWDDSWRYSLGATYNPSGNLALRAGVAYDVEAIPDAEHRTPRIPGDDRTWVAVGAGYRLTDRLTFDLAYAHLFVADPEINKNPVGEDALRGGLKGKYDASVDIVSVQLAYNF